ncbi:MAG: dihydroorotase [Candidatus Thermoplasmatota archaeon]|nr:dihydroorotase [Candidatus Thermoplasmatota archaeon]MCL5880999.1 dihydroorotase [Candidatus Thermoplasmatota archaeon]
MSYDAIYSGRFYFRDEFRELEVAVSDGVISHIGKAITGAPVTKLEGAVIPAGTDIHVHFRDPGETDKEDFSTGSLSAVYGGTTTVYDMPNNLVPVSDYSVFQDKLSSVSSRSYCDFGLYSLYNGKNADLLSPSSSGIKIFLGGSTNSTAVEQVSDNDLKILDSMNVPVVFHGEDAACLKANFIPEEHSLMDHDRARPEQCELTSAEVISRLPLKKKIMAHISTPESLPKLKGKAMAEVTPHHILLNNEMELGSWGKVNPPLRSRDTQRKLMDSYFRGSFDILSSDHAPHTEHEKEEFFQASAGIIGVETRIPLMLALVANKTIPFNLVYRTAIANPAAAMGIRKGMIQLGYFADFMAVRFSEGTRVNQDRLHSKTPISPFNGFQAVFPHSVVMHGEVILERNEFVGDRNGKFVGNLK